MKTEEPKKNGEKVHTVSLMIWWKCLLRLSETDGGNGIEERKSLSLCGCDSEHCFMVGHRDCCVFNGKDNGQSVVGVADAHTCNLSDELQRTQRLVR